MRTSVLFRGMPGREVFRDIHGIVTLFFLPTPLTPPLFDEIIHGDAEVIGKDFEFIEFWLVFSVSPIV